MAGLPANIRKRQGRKGITYQAQIRLAGRKPTSATFPTLKEAKAWLKEHEHEVRQGKYWRHSAAYSHTLSELLQRYRESHKFTDRKDNYTAGLQLDFWKDELGEMLIGDVDPATITGVLHELAEPNDKGKVRSGATINRYHAALSSAFTYGVKELGWADANPCLKISKRKDAEKRVRYLSDKEREAVLKACKEISADLYTIVVFALLTGARKSEIVTLRWSHLDLKSGYATLVDTKNDDTRTVAITGHLLDLLKQRRKERIAHLHNDDFIFPSPKDPSRPWYFRTTWRNAIKRAKVQNFRFHDCRHDFATNCLSSGATLPELMHLMGHRSPAMVARYAHMAKDHQSDIAARVTAKLFGG